MPGGAGPGSSAPGGISWAALRRRVRGLDAVLKPAACGLLLLWLGVAAARGQKPKVEAFTVGQGLPSAIIFDLAQDATGRIWILSRTGLTVYDGRDFYRPASVEALPGHRLAVLETDESGRLWTVAREEKLVYRLEGDVWHRLPAPPPSSEERPLRWATSLLVVPGGDRSGPDGPPVIVGTTDEGLLIWNGAAWTRTGASEGLASDQVTSLEALDGTIFVGTLAGLCQLEGSRVDCRQREREPRLRDLIFALRADPTGPASRRLWILGSDWLGWLEDGRLTTVAEGLEITRWDYGILGDIAVDSLGSVYFGSPAAVYSFDPVDRRLGELGLPEGLAANGLTAILSDRESAVWLGSLRGLSKISSRRFLSYDREQGLFESEVSAVVEPRPGQLVLGHNGGLTLLDGQRVETLAFDRPTTSQEVHRALDMAADGRGTVWIAAQDAGLLRLEGRTLTRVLEHANTVEIDRDGKLWAAGNAGLQISEGDDLLAVDLSLEDRELGLLRWLAASPAGGVYVAARFGLLWRDGESWRLARGPGDDATNVFTVLAGAEVAPPQGDERNVPMQGGRRNIWAGTGDGLYRLEGSELIKSSAPRIDQPVYLILEDPRGRTWFGTDDGVLIWDGATPSRTSGRSSSEREASGASSTEREASGTSSSQRQASGTLRHLSVRHGLAGRETNRGAALVDHRGRVWIGTDQGVSMYQQRYDTVQRVAPNLELRALEAGGRLWAADAEAALSHHQSTLVFHVDVITFTGEEEVEVRYRLDGFDPQWQGPAALTGSEIRYTNVPPGRYRFRIAGRRGQGEWSPEAASGSIVIAPPVWRRGWFYVLMVAGVGLIVFGAHAIRVQAMRARNRELEALSARLQESVGELERAQADREELIEDLENKNRELERFTYTVSHDLKSPLVTIRGFVGLLKKDAAAGELTRVQRDVERISAAAGTMGQLLDELLELSRIGRMVNPPETVELTELAAEAVEILSHQISEHGVEVTIDPGLPAISGDRLRLLEVLQNLIENAAKFMGDQPAPRIEVGMRRDEKPEAGQDECAEPVFFVRDNGIGIEHRYQELVFGLFERLDQSVEGTGVGLAVVQRIVEFHGGRIWVESEGEGRGSTFCFTLPAEPPGPEDAA